MEVFWCETMQNLQCRLPHTWRLLGFFFPRHTFFHRKSECFINYCKFPFNVCNPDPSILIRLDMRANKRQEVKSERAKNNFYFSLFLHSWIWHPFIKTCTPTKRIELEWCSFFLQKVFSKSYLRLIKLLNFGNCKILRKTFEKWCVFFDSRSSRKSVTWSAVPD